jgi:hypothetical protein
MPTNLEKARQKRKQLREEHEGLKRVLTCPKGCKVTLYVPGDAWCRHGTPMKEEK